MRKLVLFLAVAASAAFTATATADDSTPPGWISGPAHPAQISSHDAGTPTISLLSPVCVIKKIAYTPVSKGKGYLQLTPTASCQTAAGPTQSLWLWGGKGPKGETVSGYNKVNQILLVPLANIGRVTFSFRYGADNYWAKCGIAPNFKKYGFSGVTYCR